MPFRKWVVNDRVEFSVACGSVLARALLISDIPARWLSRISAQARTDAMVDPMNLNTNKSSASGPPRVSPLQRAKEIVVGMVRNEKDAYWLGVRMENFLRVYESRIETVSLKDACDYLESVMRKGQADWQVKQSLDAIGLLMKHGYERHELGVPQLREAWGNRLNERIGIPATQPISATGEQIKGVRTRCFADRGLLACFDAKNTTSG